MNIQQSRQYIINLTRYVLDESTFFVLDEEQCVWIASVTTSHNRVRGEEEEPFILYVEGQTFILIDVRFVSDLACWFSSLVSGNHLNNWKEQNTNG